MSLDVEHRPAVETNEILTLEQAKARIAELERLYAEEFKKARTDFKTNLPNMLAFSETEDHRKKKAGKLSILVLDIDNLKQLNSRLTNPGVDREVFAQMETFFKSKFKRKHDKVYRQGGDEFVIVFEGSEDDLTRRFYSQDNQRSQIQFETTVNGEPLVVTFSGGVVDFEGEDQKAIEQAFLAAQEAKNRGRDQIIKHSDI